MSGNSIFIRITCASAALVIFAFGAVTAARRAGTLYRNECSYYGNTAPAFRRDVVAEDLNTPDECMVWSGTAYRSLEINTNGKVSRRTQRRLVDDNAIARDPDRGCLHSFNQVSSRLRS